MVYLKERSKDFLILIQPPGVKGCSFSIKALVRSVKLTQLGHWMMGTARIYNHSITISGAYGSDGLIRAVPMEVYERASVYLPAWLHYKWSHGSGWNSAGSEVDDMRQWALDHLKELKS